MIKLVFYCGSSFIFFLFFPSDFTKGATGYNWVQHKVALVAVCPLSFLCSVLMMEIGLGFIPSIGIVRN
jgi:hypothetical protein